MEDNDFQIVIHRAFVALLNHRSSFTEFNRSCRETLPGQRQFSTAGSETFDEEETSLKTALIDENEVSSYTSPTQLIQGEINELALQKEASRIKQKLKSV